MKAHKLTAPLLTAMMVVSCSQTPTQPTAVAQPTGRTSSPEWDAGVHSMAVGDTKSGPVDIDLSLVRVGQAPGGVAAFYASPGGEYSVRPGLEIDVYAQIWTSNPAITNPRIIVDWGTGEKDNTGCGSCRLTKIYNNVGTYKVTVTLDDRVSSTTSRTFTLNVTNARAEREGFGIFSGTISTSDPTGPATYNGSPFAPPTASPGTCTPFNVSPFYTDLFTVVHEGGPITIQITGSITPFVGVFKGQYNFSSVCSNIVAMNTTTANYPAGTYVIALTTFNPGETGAYTLSIQ